MIAQVPERDRVAALQRAGVRGDGGNNLAAPEPVLADVLVVDHEVEQEARGRGEGGNDPGGEAVGVDRDAEGGGAGGEAG